MKEGTRNQNLGSDIEWTRAFEELGVSVRFVSLWNRATAFKFETHPTVLADVWPIEPDKHMDAKFMMGLAEEIVKEISEKVLAREGNDQYEINMDVEGYDEDAKVLSFVISESFGIPPSINRLPI